MASPSGRLASSWSRSLSGEPRDALLLMGAALCSVQAELLKREVRELLKQDSQQ